MHVVHVALPSLAGDDAEVARSLFQLQADDVYLYFQSRKS